MKLICYAEVDDEGCLKPMTRLVDGDKAIEITHIPDRLRVHTELTAMAYALSATLGKIGTVIYQDGDNQFVLAFEEIFTELGGVLEPLKDNMRSLAG